MNPMSAASAGAPVVLAAVAGLLGLARRWPPLAVGGLPLAVGVLNASVHQMGGVKVSLTFITGALARFGTGLANLLSGRQASREWLWQLPLWLGFAGGALAGAATGVRLGLGALWALWAAAGAGLLLAVAARLAPGLK